MAPHPGYATGMKWIRNKQANKSLDSRAYLPQVTWSRIVSSADLTWMFIVGACDRAYTTAD